MASESADFTGGTDWILLLYRRYLLLLLLCTLPYIQEATTVRTCCNRCTEISILPTREHRRAAVLQVFPGPCNSTTHAHKPTHQPTTHHSHNTHTTPHLSQNHFRLRMPRFLPFLVPHASLPACSTLSRPPTPTPTLPALVHAHAHEPCPCPRFLLLLPLLVPLPLFPVPCLPPWPFPSLCLPFWVSRPVPSCPLDPCLPSQQCLSPQFSHLRHVPKLNLMPPVPYSWSDTVLSLNGGAVHILFFSISPYVHTHTNLAASS